MREPRRVSNTEIVVAAFGMFVVLSGAATIALVSRDVSLETLWSIGVGVGLLSAVVWSLRRASAGYGEPRYGKLLLVAVVVKAAAAGAQHFVIGVAYDGVADSNAYHRFGAIVAGSIRGGSFEPYQYGSQETTNLITIVGWIYAAIGSSRVGGVVVFASISLVGAFLFDRAVRRAAPSLDLWRYSVLIYLVPTVVFWSAAIGKDAWMLLMIAMVANGFSLIVAPSPRLGGIPWIVLGLAGSLLIRPHVALILVASLAIGLLFKGTTAASAGGSGRRRALRLLALVLLVVGATFVTAEAERFFGVDALNADSVEEIFDDTRERTDTGTVIGVKPVRSPLDVPLAIVTVLFRPLPWEAPNALGLLASLESLVLIVLLGARLRPATFFSALRRSPYVVFSLSYVLLFVIAFSNIENAGILARQRTQVVPLLLVFAALPKVREESPSAAVASDPVPEQPPSVEPRGVVSSG